MTKTVTQPPAQNALPPVTAGQGVETLEDLLDQYFDIGVREGREKRDHDDMVGSAQLTREKIMAAFNADRKYSAALAQQPLSVQGKATPPDWTDEFNILPAQTQQTVVALAKKFGVPLMAAYYRAKELDLLSAAPTVGGEE